MKNHPIWKCRVCFEPTIVITRARYSRGGKIRLNFECRECHQKYQTQHKTGILNEIGGYLRMHHIVIEKYEDWSANNGNGKNK